MGVLQGNHLVFIGYVWPEPVSSAAGVRTISLVEHALAAGAKVSFLSPSKRNRFSEALEALGVSTFEVAANDSKFDELIAELGPDAVIFDRFVLEEQFGWRVFSACPKAFRLVDTQDVHFLRKARERVLNGEALNFSGDEVLRELSAVYRSHKTLVLSDFELELLTKEFKVPQDRLEYLPMCFGDIKETPKIFSDRQGFVFLGNYRHPPNLDAAAWFLDKVFPLVRQRLPGAETHFYGAYPPKEITDRHKPDKGIFMHGLASEELTELENYRVNLAPLRFGAGIKGKIADGWRFGLPTVSTAIGAEGMHLETAFGGLIADTSESFADACIALHEEEKLWEELRMIGRETLTRKFSRAENAHRFTEIIATGLKDREKLERDNTLGRILWWNQHRSTEFFSRWIEAKNKN
jgi:glycosyltransferase involved in cell wall biosynthesis